MRVWLDARRCALSHFRQAREADGMVVISVGFTSINETHANEFRQQFDGVT
jgi:hypothetical protein